MNNLLVNLVVISLMILCVREAKATENTLVFYMHDILTGNGQTALPVLNPSGSTGFGSIVVIDDVITETSDPSSTVVGKGQGMYISAAQDASSLLLLFTAVLSSPEYNQSTINFQGADRFTESRRDISVVGGTGVFKSAQGFATIETSSANGPNAVLKFTVSLRY